MDVQRLGKGGVGEGSAPDGKTMKVRWAPPGSRVAVRPTGLRKGAWSGARTALIRKPPGFTEPRCSLFALCGGCALQELELPVQRGHKVAWALSQVGSLAGVQVNRVRGADEAYGYRNKVELSFGPVRYLTQADLDAGVPLDGKFLGFHAPGRWDRVVDAERCELISEAANAALGIVRKCALAEASPVPWSQREHSGFWRHLVLRQGFATGELLVVLYTASDAHGEIVSALAQELMAAELPDGVRVVGVLWGQNAGVADVARGETVMTWGRDWLEERLDGVSFRLSATSFFQTSSRGAEILYATVGEAVDGGQAAGGTLYDLYCGTGTIGQVLRGRFDRVIGIEERPEAVTDAIANAERNGIEGTSYIAARVEDALDALELQTGKRTLVVDPPRAGLHPKVAKALAAASAEVLVYVACNPASLGRDREALEAGGWRMTALWTVDLFPQTGHIEVVGRFER